MSHPSFERDPNEELQLTQPLVAEALPPALDKVPHACGVATSASESAVGTPTPDSGMSTVNHSPEVETSFHEPPIALSYGELQQPIYHPGPAPDEPTLSQPANAAEPATVSYLSNAGFPYARFIGPNSHNEDYPTAPLDDRSLSSMPMMRSGSHGASYSAGLNGHSGQALTNQHSVHMAYDKHMYELHDARLLMGLGTAHPSADGPPLTMALVSAQPGERLSRHSPAASEYSLPYTGSYHSNSRPTSSGDGAILDMESEEEYERAGSPRNDGLERSGDDTYARLIYLALQEHPRHAMRLQELYHWFRDNTDKAKAAGTGWMNSIRHNLSMNAAFTKRSFCSVHNHASGEDAESLSCPGHVNEWFLEPWALAQGYALSTTRYRPGSQHSQRSGRRRSSSRQSRASTISRRSTSRRTSRHNSPASRRLAEAVNGCWPSYVTFTLPDVKGLFDIIPVADQTQRAAAPVEPAVLVPEDIPIDPLLLAGVTSFHAAENHIITAASDGDAAAAHHGLPAVKAEPQTDEALTAEQSDFIMCLAHQLDGLSISAGDINAYDAVPDGGLTVARVKYHDGHVVGVYQFNDKEPLQCEWFVDGVSRDTKYYN